MSQRFSCMYKGPPTHIHYETPSHKMLTHFHFTTNALFNTSNRGHHSLTSYRASTPLAVPNYACQAIWTPPFATLHHFCPSCPATSVPMQQNNWNTLTGPYHKEDTLLHSHNCTLCSPPSRQQPLPYSIWQHNTLPPETFLPCWSPTLFTIYN